MSMSPELNQEVKNNSPAEIAELLESKFQRTRLDPEVSYEITKDVAMDECGNRSEGVYQDLIAIVKAGDEYFSLIDTLVTNRSGLTQHDTPTYKETVIARHKPGHRAEVVGLIRAGSEPLTIGRSHQRDKSLSSKVSREHFAVSMSGRGNVEIADLSSSNGTEVFTNPEDERGSIDSSIGGIDFWSVKSSDMRSAIEDRYVRKI